MNRYRFTFLKTLEGVVVSIPDDISVIKASD
jgi:hypothetical protein